LIVPVVRRGGAINEPRQQTLGTVRWSIGLCDGDLLSVRNRGLRSERAQIALLRAKRNDRCAVSWRRTCQKPPAELLVVADAAASGVCADGLAWAALGMLADRSGARRRRRLGSGTLLGALPRALGLSARKLCHQRGRCYASYRRPEP
jgi:hypothetical protein